MSPQRKIFAGFAALGGVWCSKAAQLVSNSGKPVGWGSIMPKPRDSDTKGKPSNRRRRRFGGGSKRQQNPSPGNHGRDDPGLLSDSISAGVTAITWLWHTTASVLSWRSGRIGGARGWSAANDGLGNSPSGSAGVVLVFGAATTAGAVLILRRRKRRSGDQVRPQPPAGTTEPTLNNDERQSGRGRPEEKKEPRPNDCCPQGPAQSRTERSTGTSPPRENIGSRLHLGWSPRHRQTKTVAAPSAASGERRISLYDVLTGEAPLPPSRNLTAAGSEATAAAGNRSGEGGLGYRGGGGGVLPLGGGARRASIFDRIADVVFNEEQKEQNPVDAVAVRSGLAEEFRVSFREGAMGMTLSMDPDTRDAVVGKIVEQGQAFRAGVQTEDSVIGVGEHTVSSYGTVLAFMNIMGRPIELRFRKAKTPVGEGTVASGGGPVPASRAGAVYGGDGGGSGGSPAIPENSPLFSSTDALKKHETMSIRGSLDSARGDSSTKRSKGVKSGGGKAPLSPISPRSSGKVSGLSGLGREVASSDASFSQKMEHGVVVTKYGKKGAAAQRVLYLDGESRSVAWRELDASSPGHRRSTSLTNIIKGKREVLALAHLIEVVAGDDPDPARPSEKGSALLREHCDESLLERSFALQFKERSLEMTCDSHVEMRQLVAGFRDLQKKYGQ